MKKVMVCGCGAQGSTICRRLDEEPNIEEVVCADYNLAAAEAVCKLMKKGTPKQVNAANVDEIAKAAGDFMTPETIPQLQALLASFGVAGLPELPADKLAAFAAELRKMGAKI